MSLKQEPEIPFALMRVDSFIYRNLASRRFVVNIPKVGDLEFAKFMIGDKTETLKCGSSYEIIEQPDGTFDVKELA